MTEPSKSVAELFRQAPEPRDTRERILYAGLELFHEHGFHAIGLDRILTAASVTKTTFYNHFESRDALIREAIELRDRWDQGVFEQRIRELAGYDPKAMLLAMFDVLDEWFTHEDFAGCLFMHACSEFPDRRDPIHRAAAAHFAVSRENVAQMAKAVGISEPEAFAAQWVLLLEGAIIHRVISGDDHAARTAKSIAELLLERASG